MDKTAAPREQWPALMAQAQAGDQQAYTRLLTALVPVIRSLVRKQITDDVLTEDIIQDVLLTVHRVRHTYDPACPFLPWLVAITHARSVDALRWRGRQRRWETEDSDILQYAADSSRTASGEQQESREQLAQFLDQLPARQREIVEHVHLQQMSLAEAAQKNSLSIAAVKSLLHRALNNLRRSGAQHGKS
ncbi:sigma-70 family RNA polymerase sigma factor [Erwinia sp. V71]|uniref:sigma-70 family RNA polymerase sigma factor n=1 Tax=Erwinia sp. V71 TaxID=3369424 RepID=UPI003F63DF8A